MVESIFMKTEIQYELLSGIIAAVVTVAKEAWVAKLLLSLAKAYNFDMTLMFLEDTERTKLEQICKESAEGKKIR
jgi:hypothetical protein